MTAVRTIQVPLGCKAVIVTDQLLAHFKDWQQIGNEEVGVEAKVEPINDLVVDIQTRYVVYNPT